MSEITEGLERPDPLLLSMKTKLLSYDDGATQHEPFSIYQVPPSFREADPSAYQPQNISIGPHHHNDPKLQAMEDHKWRCMHNLLVRRPQIQSDFTTALERCIEKVKQSEARARRYYSAPTNLNGDDFVMMMVLDGCFILEIFLIILDYQTDEKDGPIHGAAIAWMLPSIRRDLLKLENQIPFFVLEDLFSVAAGPSVTHLSLKELTVYFLKAGALITTSNRFGEKQLVVYHLLHFYHLLLQPTAEEDKDTPQPTAASITNNPTFSSYVKSIIRKMNTFTSCILHISESLPIAVNRTHTMIPCAVELREAGIKLRRKKDAKSFLDVSFSDGSLDIPRLCVDDSTYSIFRNLIVFEQCCRSNADHHITSYTSFLDYMINTAKDVAILQQRGIIENLLGSEEEVALLINRLCKEVTVDYRNQYLGNVFQELNVYCESKWHKHRARFVRDYIGNPWKSISVVAGAALLLLTVIQVIFAVLSYKKQ